MGFQTFKCIYIEEDSPEDLEYLININEIEYVSVNTSGSDTDNIGPYFVWIYLKSGECLAVFCGTKEECKDHFNLIKKILG